MKNDARFLAYKILNQFNNKTKLDNLIEKVLTKYNPNYLVRSRCRVIICDVIRLLGRIDFIIDKNENYYFLEINTLPGMTSTSLLPIAAKAQGLSFNELVKKIIDLGLKGKNFK